MNLLSSRIIDYYESLNSLLVAVNTHAASQDYAVVKKRIKNSKKGVLRKVVLMCDRSYIFIKNTEYEKRNKVSRECECPFDAVVTLIENKD